LIEKNTIEKLMNLAINFFSILEVFAECLLFVFDYIITLLTWWRKRIIIFLDHSIINKII